jgi:hypothetical protein
MSLDLIATIWDELKHYIPSDDRSEAADAIVMAMIDNDYDYADIKQAFRGDKEIKTALASHSDEEIEEEDLDEYDEDADSEEW